MAVPSPLQNYKRYITTHTPEGKAIFSNTISTEPHWGNIGPAKICLAYATKQFPEQVGVDEKDVKLYGDMIRNPPGLVISTGTVLRLVDMKPGHVSPMHRTVSLDYCVCMKGPVELLLDSGEARTLETGDIVVERATMHQWRNPSETHWVRMLYVLTPVEPVEIDGLSLGEDYGDMGDVPKST